MRRRSGQNGTVVIQSGFYRVRWRMDVDGQEARINMSQIIAPVVLDKDGNPKPPSPGIRRKAKEIVEQSGANAEARCDEVTLGEVLSRERAVGNYVWRTGGGLFEGRCLTQAQSSARHGVSRGSTEQVVLSCNQRPATQPGG